MKKKIGGTATSTRTYRDAESKKAAGSESVIKSGISEDSSHEHETMMVSKRKFRELEMEVEELRQAISAIVQKMGSEEDN